jgi:hypothetical protein
MRKGFEFINGMCPYSECLEQKVWRYEKDGIYIKACGKHLAIIMRKINEDYARHSGDINA